MRGGFASLILHEFERAMCPIVDSRALLHTDEMIPDVVCAMGNLPLFNAL
jgi:hypothetical protein